MGNKITYNIETHSTNDLLSSQVRAGTHESFELQVLTSLLTEGDYVIDIGANIGLHSVNFGKAVKENGKVYSFEPILDNYEILERNIGLHNLEKVVQPYNCALGSKDTDIDFFYNTRNTGDSRPAITEGVSNRTCQLLRGDSLEILSDTWDKITLIKMDTQGCEIDILKGFEKLLDKKIPNFIFMEFWPYGLRKYHYDIDYLLQFIEKNNLKIHELMRNNFSEVDLGFVETFSRNTKNIHTNLLLTTLEGGAWEN